MIRFLEMNIIIIAGVLLIVFIYLISLINKRRKNQFLHQDKEK